jgi:tetratricopeptide (TPR) repeat protein
MWLRPVVALDSLTFYLATVLLPLNLIPDYGRTTAALVASGALVYSWIPAVALLAAAGIARTKAPLVTVAVAFFVVPLLPVLGLVPFDFQYFSNVADHYLYLAMVGPAIGLALAYRRFQPPRVAVALVFAILCAASFAQAAHWKDDATLAARTLAVNPRSRFMAHNDWGRFLEERGQLEEAMLHYRQALAADPGDLAVLNDIGNVLIKQGRYDEAIRHYTEIIAQRAVPGDTAARMHNNLGAAYANKGMYDAAAGEFRRAIDIDPEYIDPYNNLGLVLMASGHRAEAVEVLRRGLAVNPHHPALRRLLDLAVSRPGG